ncbi:hypothetical protein HY489_05705 [Candidatus Woesearchaeota archaeon]|nr:hypothetical protein [Candidatus Woesearchaeota archaeon]
MTELAPPVKGEDHKEYYRKLKAWQLQDRERRFYLQYSLQNPLSSKRPEVANAKEREIWRTMFFQRFGKNRLMELIQEYVIPCSEVEPELQHVLTDDLLISCIGKWLRRYNKVRATELGGNQFKYYLVKENWKRESANHLIWKFELKRLFNCQIEQHDNDTQGRFDAVLKKNGKTIIIEIVCKRQSVNQALIDKLLIKAPEIERKGYFVVLAPQRIHKYLKGVEDGLPGTIHLTDSKNILSLLDTLVNGREVQNAESA